MSRTIALAYTTTVLITSASALASGTYYPLGAGRTPSSLSADGSVAGVYTGSPNTPFYIWQLSNPGITTNIGGNWIAGSPSVSADGDKIAASMAGFVGAPPIPGTVTNQMAVYDVSDFSWTALGGIGWFSGTETASGWGISGNGNVVVGLGWSPNQTNAYAITSTNGGAPVALPWLVPGRSTRANGCDADGSVVVGWQDNPFGFRQACVWINGVGQRLWRSYPKQPLGEAQACSADGNWVVGLGGGNTDSQAWRWSGSTGMQLLGELNTTAGWNAGATDITADGNTIIGYERPFGPATQGWGFIWTATGGMQNLTTYVQAQGVTLPVGVTTLALPLAISDDGLTIAGLANNGQGWVVRLDPPGESSCPGDVDGDQFVNMNDLLSVLNTWGSCQVPDACPADLNDDNQVNIDDLLEVVNAWGDCQ